MEVSPEMYTGTMHNIVYILHMHANVAPPPELFNQSSLPLDRALAFREKGGW